MNVRRDVAPGGGVVRFDVRGKQFTLALEALEQYPESYIAWIVQNNPDHVRSGKPIPINRRPDMFKNLLKSISAGPGTHSDNSEKSLQPTKTEIPRSLHEHMPNSGPCTPPPPPPPPPPAREMFSSPSHHSSNKLLRSSRPKNPYEAFNIQRTHQSNHPSVSSASTHHPLDMDDMDSRDFESRSGCSRPPTVSAPKGTDLVVEEAVQDIAKILVRYTKHRQMYDKAIIMLTWGHSGEGGRVLRPRLSKLYDSMTGRMHDVRRSSEGSASFERADSSGWGGFDSAYSATCISTRAQSLVVEGLRSAVSTLM